MPPLQPLPLKAAVPKPSHTKKFLIRGMVQGVGFRPHVYRLATSHGLGGEVANSLAGVELVLTGSTEAMAALLTSLQENPPPGALITAIEEEQIPARAYPGFTIGPSQGNGVAAPLAPADFGMCDQCARELRDPTNHRFQHPFISCTACGPRFTLLHGLPYDRPLTSMAAFPLCPVCQGEYDDPASRRFHAEPICCPQCGPTLVFHDESGAHTTGALARTAALLQAGGVAAIKGVGGFHLAVDACNPQAVARLRAIKQRPDKPLAIMVRDLQSAAALAEISPAAAALLTASARPIVILPRRRKTPLAPGIAPGLSEVGIMLAYTPLHELLFEQGPPVLVMTSFNAPGNPMLTRTAEAVRLLGTHCDGVLSHQRRIISRCDDSVWRLHGDRPRLLRRSRGYAPLPVALGAEAPAILACGAGEKVTICLTRGSQAFFSQHLGETRSPAGQEHYCQATAHLQALLHIRPQILAHDLHPNYYSSRFAATFVGLQKIAVQHHHAHIVSCMVEHHLHRPVLGLALDGTGLGPDHSLWGGEVLLCDRRHYRRLAHFAPLAMPGGEAAISHPWRLALAWLHQEGLQQRELAFLGKITNNDRQMVGQMLARGLNCPSTTSLGRLFDAVAALINLRTSITFAAQAAMELEAIADDHEKESYPMTITAPGPDTPLRLETGALLHALVNDLDRGTGQAIMARRFHNTIIRALTATCLRLAEAEGIAEVACSGGVFQNRLISEGLRLALQEAGLTVHCHQKIPCNDGGLALGQAAVAAAVARQEGGPDQAASRHA